MSRSRQTNTAHNRLSVSVISVPVIPVRLAEGIYPMLCLQFMLQHRGMPALKIPSRIRNTTYKLKGFDEEEIHQCQRDANALKIAVINFVNFWKTQPERIKSISDLRSFDLVLKVFWNVTLPHVALVDLDPPHLSEFKSLLESLRQPGSIFVAQSNAPNNEHRDLPNSAKSSEGANNIPPSVRPSSPTVRYEDNQPPALSPFQGLNHSGRKVSLLNDPIQWPASADNRKGCNAPDSGTHQVRAEERVGRDIIRNIESPSHGWDASQVPKRQGPSEPKKEDQIGRDIIRDSTANPGQVYKPVGREKGHYPNVLN
ncbi:hypothetical protein T439DRAFT_351117 [Meredithblackwellia eburnea MCA 4105]